MKKANGSYRMCNVCREVNQVTSPQHQPLVSVAEVVDVFGEKKRKICSTQDMFSGNHQMKMTEDSKKFIEFTTPDGEHLAFNRLCSGYITSSTPYVCHSRVL